MCVSVLPVGGKFEKRFELTLKGKCYIRAVIIDSLRFKNLKGGGGGIEHLW